MTRQPAVLLISPGILKWTDMDFGLPHLVSMGGYLQAHVSVRVEVLDLNYEGGDQRQLQRTLADLGPFLLIGVSCFSSFDYLRTLTLGRFLKGLYPDVPLVTGGYHASALPRDLVFDGSPFDAVIAGEGELPLLDIVRDLLGGGRIETPFHGPRNVEELDTLPPYRWELLARYWGRAHDIGKKLQIYLSRGCPYHCTFCMERAKTEYRWRAYSSGRAVEELQRLARFTDLGRWVVNLADPLFGFRRRWRREVLEGIVRHRLLPRQYWTLTRSDDLDEDDVRLLGQARFSIGIGLESGSPDMLRRTQQGNEPGRYLDAMMRLARLSRAHGVRWATNIIVGHPGETPATLRETRDYVQALFSQAGETCGWLSIDPFRLYPGAYVHETMDTWERETGAHFYHRTWWKSWYDGPFRAEHIDPSRELDFEGRVRFMYDAYPPLVQQIAENFRGKGESIDRVYRRSLDEQVRQLSPAARDAVLARGARARRDLAGASNGGAAAPVLNYPIGLHVRDPWVRKREEAVRRMLERGVLRTDALIEALLEVAPERFLTDDEADSVLRDAPASAQPEGPAPRWLGISTLTMALEALEPTPGDAVCHAAAASAYLGALLSALVGPDGAVTLLTDRGFLEARRLRSDLGRAAGVDVVRGDPTAGAGGPYDRLILTGAVPRFPKALLHRLRDPEGRAVAFLGPRFRPQDLVCLVRRGEALDERRLARIHVPALAGESGWLRRSA